MVPVGFLSDPRFADHQTGRHHPERPDRIRAIARAVRQAGLISSPDPFPDFKIDLGLSDLGIRLVELPPPPPVDEKWLLTVHGSGYIEKVHHASDLGDTSLGGRKRTLVVTARAEYLNPTWSMFGRDAELDFKPQSLAGAQLQRPLQCQATALVDTLETCL